jgi:DNA-binding MarR family transcriptional regulator
MRSGGNAESAWHATLRAHHALLLVLERELRESCGMSLASYDVLVQLWQAPGRSMRMSELADAVLVSRSWQTRRVDDMEAAGLVARCACPEDGRGVSVRMTPHGTKALARAKRSHGRSIERHIAVHLTDAEATVLRDTMSRIDAAARRTIQSAHWRGGRPDA